ncbi:MAG: arginine--tRNA ligase [Planctomycetota bacterium]|nr:MAG: arginine--tRNA ligase [Planctomycetota bacterium]
MKPTIVILDERISASMVGVTGKADCEAQVCPATDPKFGDYQANGVMPLAKQLKTDPRKLAEKVVEGLDVSDICELPEIAGPGFINLRLKPDFVADRLLKINADPQNRLDIAKAEKPETIVVDFSGPNIAKQMHVGHLRSTIIGDCICRFLEFLGHNVIRQNHIGDWGLQMGMVVYALEDVYWEQDEPKLNLEILEQEYKRIVELEKEDPEIADKVRKRTAELQAKEPLAMRYWREACGITMSECYRLYVMMGVNLSTIHTVGESFYKDMLTDVVEELKKKSLAVESDGAICVFPVDSTGSPQAGFKNKEGEPLPLIIQKSDGAYLYATTDLAAIRYRINELKADRIIYVTDARQKLHFEMLFAVARMAKWVSDDIELSHVMFGSVLGEDGAPLKTRSGENVKLKELLDEAVKQARKVVDEKNADLPDDEKDRIAKAVGIGAVKYADFSNNRTSDYVFSFDRMLAMDGNTAPYMQYAYARIKSIGRKAVDRDIKAEKELKGITNLNITEPSELDLAKHLVRYGEAIEAAINDYRPNYLTSYLYELAQKFSVFYTNCPVLDAGAEKRPTRLLLCDLTAKTIEHGLKELLGIEVVDQM